MISQTGRHRWGTGRTPDTIGSSSAERPDRPAEVVAVGDEIGRRLMDVPILGKSVSPPDLSSVLMPVRAIVALHKGDVDIAAAHGVDYLLTWNCRHIDNPATQPLVRGVCLSEGYACPEICTPFEIMELYEYEE